MRRHRHAKIVATIGPASSAPERLRELFLAGADVFRLNFSHGTHDDHRRVHAADPRARAGDGPPDRASCRTCRAPRSGSA